MVHFGDIDPYRPDGGRYECLSCGYRTESGERPTTCPLCSGEIRNIALPRE